MAGWAGFPASGLVFIPDLLFDARHRPAIPGMAGLLPGRLSLPERREIRSSHCATPRFLAMEDNAPSSKVQQAGYFGASTRFAAWRETGPTICYISIKAARSHIYDPPSPDRKRHDTQFHRFCLPRQSRFVGLALLPGQHPGMRTAGVAQVRT